MEDDDMEFDSARKLGCEVSSDPVNPLLPIMQACMMHHPGEDMTIRERAYKRALI